MVPSFSILSSRMTPSLAPYFDVGSRPIWRARLIARASSLLLGADRGDAARDDLASLGDEALEQADVLVIDLRRILAREGAALAAAEKWACHVAVSLRLSVEFVAAAAAVAVAARSTIVVAIAATLVALTAAHHHRRTLLMLTTLMVM
jgi:hypothetical protein